MNYPYPTLSINPRINKRISVNEQIRITNKNVQTVLNVGLGKAAMQSSTVGVGSAQRAVDGQTSQFFAAATCTMTDAEANPWWYVNLLEPYLVQIVRIDFGTGCCGKFKRNNKFACRPLFG